MGTLPHHGDIHMEMPAAGGVLALWQCCRAVLGPAFPPNTRRGSSTPYLPYTPVLSPTAYSCHLPRAASQGPPPQGAHSLLRGVKLSKKGRCVLGRMWRQLTTCSCWGGAAPFRLSATTTRVLGALQKTAQPLGAEVNPHGVQGQQPQAGIPVRNHSHGPSHALGLWHWVHTKHSVPACSSPTGVSLGSIGLIET